MSRRGGMLVGLMATALLVVAIAWLLGGDAERSDPASVLAVRPAAAPAEALPPVAIAAAAADDVQSLPPAAGDGAPTVASPSGPAELHCRVVTGRDGAPLADVEVIVFHHTVPYQPGPGRSVARTGADGVARFSFPFASKAWLVRALPGPGHALCELRPETAIEPGRVETLELRTTRGATVSGVVVDEEKRPVPNALVLAWCELRVNVESGDGPMSEPDLIVQADGAGRFLAESIGPAFVLAASAPGMASVRAFHGVLREDDVRDDAVLTLGPAQEIRGRVLDPSRRPLAQLWVQARCFPRDQGFGVPTTGKPLKVAVVTDADGRFVLQPLAARAWDLTVKHERYGQWNGERKPDGTEVEIVFAEGCVVSGLVRGADGAPLAGATLSLQGASEDAGYGPSGWASVTSGDDGRFLFEGLIPTTEALLGVSAAAHAVHVIDHLVVSPETREPLELRLVPELAIGGQVVDESGQPLRGAAVSLRGDRIADVNWRPKPSWEGITGKGGGVTDGDGRFRLDQLYDGEFVLTVKDPRHEGLSAVLTVRSGVEDLLVRLDPAALRGAVVAGTVRDGITGAPLSEFSVWFIAVDEALRPAHGRSSGGNFNDPTGAYRVQGLPPGEYRISAHATGYAMGAEGPLMLVAGENAVELALLPERTLRLRVVDQEGAPVTLAYVDFEDARGERIQLMSQPMGDGTIGATDKKGEVTAQGLPAAQVVAVLKVARVSGLAGLQIEHRFPFDLRHEPVGVQQVVLPRDKQRVIVVGLYQLSGGDASPEAPAGAFAGFDSSDTAALEWLEAHFIANSITQPVVSVTATLHATGGAELASSSCDPSGKTFALRSTLYAGDSVMPALLFALPQEATRIDVTAAGCAPVSLDVPAGDKNMRRVVVLRAAE